MSHVNEEYFQLELDYPRWDKSLTKACALEDLALNIANDLGNVTFFFDLFSKQGIQLDLSES